MCFFFIVCVLTSGTSQTNLNSAQFILFPPHQTKLLSCLLCFSLPPCSSCSSSTALPVVVVSGPRATCGIHQIPSLPFSPLPAPRQPSRLFTLTRANLQQSRSTRAGAAAAALLENVQREEVGCPLGRDLGQRKAGGREASLLCVYLKREPFTAVSWRVFIHRTDTEQMRRDISGTARARLFLRSGGSDVMRLEKKRGGGGEDSRLCTVQSKINCGDLWCGA